MGGGDGRVREELNLDSGDPQMVGEIKLHLFEIDSFEMAFCHDARSERQGGAVLKQIDEIILARKNHGQMRFGVDIELAEGMQFGEDIEPQKTGLIDDEERLDFLVCEHDDGVANDARESSPGKAFGLDIEGGGQLVP
ncbi:MAG: hypothetical protein HW419_4538 [Deltaproteobacteria bacterium]|nr:hypothetical protein [Deltaproteobacteria bacterium]